MGRVRVRVRDRVRVIRVRVIRVRVTLRTASTKDRSSIFFTKVMVLPEAPHEKQLYSPLSSLRPMLGFLSSWKGHTHCHVPGPMGLSSV